MVVKIFEIKKYYITQSNDGEKTGSYGGKKAWIHCYDPAGIFIGTIYFMSADGIQPPIYNPDPKWKICGMFFDIQRFNEVITTLRYEKPIWFKYELDEKTNRVKDAVILTNPEPIGEQEGQGAPFTTT